MQRVSAMSFSRTCYVRCSYAISPAEKTFIGIIQLFNVPTRSDVLHLSTDGTVIIAHICLFVNYIFLYFKNLSTITRFTGKKLILIK